MNAVRRTGERIWSYGASRHVQRSYRRIPRDRRGVFHSLRRAFGTHAVRAGANIEAVRELMGHGDLETTARYLHTVAADKVAVIEAIGQILAGNAASPVSPTP